MPNIIEGNEELSALDMLDIMQAEDYFGSSDWENKFLTDYYDRYEKYGEKTFVSDEQEYQIKRIFNER
jgi:hypothetical protein